MRTKASRRLATLLATGFGLGYAPLAPGTAGSLAAALLALVGAAGLGWNRLHFLVLAVAWIAPAVWAAGVESRATGRKDPGHIVIDEVVGLWATIAGAAVVNWKSCLAAFLLFRALDVWKPFPARRAERLPGGVGIVADDLVAGAYGALVLYLAGCFNLY